jgi:hypothetical protein
MVVSTILHDNAFYVATMQSAESHEQKRRQTVLDLVLCACEADIVLTMSAAMYDAVRGYLHGHSNII